MFSLLNENSSSSSITLFSVVVECVFVCAMTAVCQSNFVSRSDPIQSHGHCKHAHTVAAAATIWSVKQAGGQASKQPYR